MLTAQDVKAWLRLPADDATDDDLIGSCVAATNAWVAATAYVTGLDPVTWPGGEWPPDVTLGATMLAARLYRRRNTPAGIEAIADGAVYVPRRDSDVDSMLHMGAWAPPRVG
jgi:hypothetical protein